MKDHNSRQQAQREPEIYFDFERILVNLVRTGRAPVLSKPGMMMLWGPCVKALFGGSGMDYDRCHQVHMPWPGACPDSTSLFIQES